jgi:NADPH:quinone reductase-like Zn-dependent oxidoreductase
VGADGADEVIDHTVGDLADAAIAPVDVLLNLAPLDPAEFTALVGLVRDGGVVVSTTAWLETPGDADRNVRAETVFVRSDAAQLARLVDLVDRSELRVDAAERVTLRELPAVHERIAAGALRGKVVVVPAA